MKKCLCCGSFQEEAAPCTNCGEASWEELEVEVAIDIDVEEEVPHGDQ